MGLCSADMHLVFASTQFLDNLLCFRLVVSVFMFTVFRDPGLVSRFLHKSLPGCIGVGDQCIHYFLSHSDINFALRKIVCLLKPTKQVEHDPATGGMRIRTMTTFKNFDMDFSLGKEFTEDLGPVDGRVCQVGCVCLMM